MVTVANHQASNLRNMPAAITDGVSVAQLLAAPSLVDITVLAGYAGLDRAVRGVSVLELPDIVPWVKPYELLLSTAGARGPMADGERPAELLALIADLDARQVPALALRLGAEPLPVPVAEFADELGFPILRLPTGLTFEEVL